MNYRFSLALLLSCVLCLNSVQAKCPRDNAVISSSCTSDQTQEVIRWISVLSNERIEELIRDIRSIRDVLNSDLTQLSLIPNVESMVRTIRENDMTQIQQELDKLVSFFQGSRQNSIFDRILERIQELLSTLHDCCDGNIVTMLEDIIDQLDELEDAIIAIHATVNNMADDIDDVHDDLVMVLNNQAAGGVLLNNISDDVDQILLNQTAGGVTLNNLVNQVNTLTTQVNNVIANQAAGGVILNNLVQDVADLQATVDDIQETVNILEDIIIVS